MGALAIVCLIAAILVAVDQVTKLWAVAALSGHARIPIIGDLLGLVLVRNPGAAFSLATGQTWIFSVVALVVVVVVIRASRGLGSRAWTIALGLVLGGAVGNLIDRLVRAPGPLRGHVVDFIDYGGQFVGNVADIAIVGAAGAIMVLSVLGINLDGTRAGEDDDHHGAVTAAGAAIGPEGVGETRRSRRARRRDESGARA
ncbi:signal peptidase II [Actinomyces gaoshouyii]|nr:signal peptidase II [Actinomyces gaoshouyii]ARD42762.1 signal peptidase II [Actinomyces gaoshouyii]